jgi:hypothetical protein
VLAADPDAVVFERHYAASPDTEASIASIMTGQPTRPGSPPTSERPTLIDLFARAGFFTFEHELQESARAHDELEDLIRGAPKGFFGFVHLDHPDPAAAERLLEGLGRFNKMLLVVTSDHGLVEDATDGIGADLRESRRPCWSTAASSLLNLSTVS